MNMQKEKYNTSGNYVLREGVFYKVVLNQKESFFGNGDGATLCFLENKNVSDPKNKMYHFSKNDVINSFVFITQVHKFYGEITGYNGILNGKNIFFKDYSVFLSRRNFSFFYYEN